MRYLAGLLDRFLTEQGQTLAEYGLIISVIILGAVAIIASVLTPAISGAFQSAADCIINRGC